MAATVVTTGGGGNVSTTGSSTLAVTITTPTSGNLLVVCSSGFNNISSISGGGVTTWSNVNGPFSGDTNHNDEGQWWGVVDGTPGTTVTITYLSSMSFRAARVIEVAGAQKATDAVVSFANDAQGATDSKTITTVTDGCCIISAIGVHGGTTGTGPTGYTQLGNEASGDNGLYVAYLNQTTHGASTMNWSGLGSTTWPALGAIAIKPAGGSTVSISWATTGTASPSFSLKQTDKITLAAASAATPAFSLKQTDKVLLATTGHAAPAFSLKQTDSLGVATRGAATPSFGLKQTDSVVASTIGRSNPVFSVSGGAPTVKPDTHLSVAINKLRIH